MKYTAKANGEKFTVSTYKEKGVPMGFWFDTIEEAQEYAATESACWHLRKALAAMEEVGLKPNNIDNYHQLANWVAPLKMKVEDMNSMREGYDELDPCTWC